MYKLLKNRYLQIIIVLVVLFVLLNFIIPEKYFLSPVRNIFLKITSPVVSLMYSGGDRTHGFFSQLGRIKSLSQENEELERKIAKLLIENSEIQETKRENEILRSQLDLKKEFKELELIAAEIIGRGPSNISSNLIIGEGSSGGISRGMPVVSGNMLIGKIDEVESDFSRVLLIVDPGSVVNVMIQESRAIGVLKGETGFNLVVESIPQEVELKKGQRIVTSGLGGTFPKGLVIGEIDEIKSPKSDIFQSANVRPVADFNHLEIIFVIKF